MQGKWRENLIKIKPYVAGEQSNDKDMIKLNANENPYPPSPQVKKVFEKYAQNSDGLKKYPNSDSIILKDAIAQRYNVNRNNVFVGNGSDDVIALSFMAFFNSAVGVLQTLVVALGAGLGIWGAINLLEGYGNDNPGANAHVP